MLAGAGAVLTGWLLATVVRHGGEAVYDLPTWSVILGVAAGVAAVVGWILVAGSRGWTGVGVAVVGSLVVASIGVIPILGVLFFVGGMVWMARTAQAETDRRGLAGGLLVAVALPLAALVATDGPIVRCTEDGATVSSSTFRPGESSTGAGESGSGGGSRSGTAEPTAPGSTTEGTHTSGGRTYTYRCAGGRLVDFTRT